MTISLFPIILNVVFCILIIFRIVIWRRNGKRYRPFISLLAWLLVVSCAAVIMSLLSGYYRVADWAETLINGLLCTAVYYSSGNIAHLFKFRMKS